MGLFNGLRKAAEVDQQAGEVAKIKDTVDRGVPSAIRRAIQSAGQQRSREDRERRDHPAATGLIPGQVGPRHTGDDPSKGQGSGGTKVVKSDGKGNRYEVPKAGR